MDAVVLAGGIPQPAEPLYPYIQGKSKALVDLNGKAMVQWVLDALSGSDHVERVVVIGLDLGEAEQAQITCAKPLTFEPTHGGMLQNIVHGIEKVTQINPASRPVLLVSGDIPGITPEIVSWVIDTALQSDDDIYYHLVRREVMEKRYPGSRRSYIKLKDVEVCGGDMNVVQTKIISSNREIWERLVESRKNALKQAAILGFDTLFLLALRLITLQEAVERVSRRLKIRGRGVLCPYAEVAMDVDKPHQLELMRADLAKQARA
ncbi:MAG: nucleotidyltransferase family protein [Anaerolineales bacterium]|nr:nucleotidyltransferase family protein [Anaerolineales bacterium]